MYKTVHFICLMIAFSTAVNLQGQTNPQEEMILGFREMSMGRERLVIPITLASTQILVDDVFVNGKGPFRFMLDTGGMGGGRIDQSLVEKLGLKASGKMLGGDGTSRKPVEMDVFQLESLSVQGFNVKDVKVLSRDYNEHGAAVRGRIDGILGFGLFKDVLLTIDYSTRQLTVEKGELPIPNDKNILSFEGGGVPLVDVQLGGENHKAHLDTGAMSWISVSEEIANRMSFVDSPDKVGEARTLTGSFPIQRAQLQGEFTLGDETVQNPFVVFGKPLQGVNIGGFVLRDFVITYDQTNRRIKVMPVEQRRPDGVPGYARLPRGPVSVELDMSSGHPIIEAEINGLGPFKFILDTGADTVLLDSDLADQLKLESTGNTKIGDPSDPNAVDAKTYLLDKISVGEAEFGCVGAVGWKGFGLPEVRGVIGVSTFYDSLVEFNYPENLLTIRRGSLGPNEGVAFYLDQGSYLTIDLEIGGKKLKTHIDSGNMGEIALPLSIAGDLELESPPVVIGRARTISGQFDIHQAKLDGDISIAGKTIENPTIHFNDQFDWGNIGSKLLSDFVLVLDQTNQRLKLSRPENE